MKLDFHLFISIQTLLTLFILSLLLVSTVSLAQPQPLANEIFAQQKKIELD